MAYNYNPYQYQFQQQYPNNQQMQSGFVSVRSVEEAFNYPVAPGNSITFKDENSPFVYTKTKGFSPLEQPVFERYRLVKVEEPQRAPETPVETFDAKGEINALWNEIKALKAAMKGDRHGKPSNDKPDKAVHAESK